MWFVTKDWIHAVSISLWSYALTIFTKMVYYKKLSVQCNLSCSMKIQRNIYASKKSSTNKKRSSVSKISIKYTNQHLCTQNERSKECLAFVFSFLTFRHSRRVPRVLWTPAETPRPRHPVDVEGLPLAAPMVAPLAPAWRTSPEKRPSDQTWWRSKGHIPPANPTPQK